MSSFIRSIFALQVATIVLLVVSCSKKADIVHVPGEAQANYWPDQRYCNIDSIRVTGSNKYYKFSYDAQGDPVSIITNGTSLGDPNWFFYYDSQKRMSKYITLYDDGFTFEHFKKFVYGPNNRVIRDTLFVFGTVLNGELDSWSSYEITTYGYDTLNRISRTTWYPPFGGEEYGENTYYLYNASGNRYASGVTYDNKNNLHNTNKWWRLIDREYSKNNPYTATSYTGYLLPRDFASYPGLSSGYFLGINMLQGTIRYICD
jgi:hypothetical protein